MSDLTQHPTNREAEERAVARYRKALREMMQTGYSGKAFASADFADGIIQMWRAAAEPAERLTASGKSR